MNSSDKEQTGYVRPYHPKGGNFRFALQIALCLSLIVIGLVKFIEVTDNDQMAVRQLAANSVPAEAVKRSP